MEQNEVSLITFIILRKIDRFADPETENTPEARLSWIKAA